jgi:hypothetical protein
MLSLFYFSINIPQVLKNIKVVLKLNKLKLKHHSLPKSYCLKLFLIEFVKSSISFSQVK